MSSRPAPSAAAIARKVAMSPTFLPLSISERQAWLILVRRSQRAVGQAAEAAERVVVAAAEHDKLFSASVVMTCSLVMAVRS
jgi:hypothetical protein